MCCLRGWRGRLLWGSRLRFGFLALLLVGWWGAPILCQLPEPAIGVAANPQSGPMSGGEGEDGGRA